MMIRTTLLITALVLAPGGQQTTPEIPALILQLADRQTEWKAASQLQKLGAPAAAALVAQLRRDGFRDRDHGNHSPTMRALEKIGDPAVREIERAMTPGLLTSADPEDIRYLETAVRTLSTIGGSTAAPALLRAGLLARDSRIRELAFNGVTTPSLNFEPTRPGRPWEACLQHEAPLACPFHPEVPRVAAAVRPQLEEIRGRMEQEANARVRFAAAQVLGLWGIGPLKGAGERELLQTVTGSDSYLKENAIRTLGLLGSDAARSAIKAAAVGNSIRIKQASAEALFRLQDDGYIPITLELMKLQTVNLEPYNEDIYLRRQAIRLAGRSHNLDFVPTLIDMLGERSWNGGTTTTTVNGRSVETRHTFGEDALAALRALTFEDLGSDPQSWSAWWNSNRTRNWHMLLSRYVERMLPQIATAQPWVMNEWISKLSEADDLAALPLLKAYFSHPRLEMSQVGPNSFRGGGEMSPALLLLLNLSSQGSNDARQLLDGCSNTNHYPLAIECSRMVAVFDRERGIGRLRDLRGQPFRYWVAHALVQLGDSQGISTLIEELEATEVSSRTLAFQDLQQYTQMDLHYDANAPGAARKAAADEWRRWWRTVEATFTVTTHAARIDLDCCRK